MGYFGMPEKTVEAWRNLWFHTGDALRKDADGWFYFVDRYKDALRRRGENISSYEVEQGLLSHPAVLEVAVIAVPADSEAGEDEVMAYVVASGPVDAAELWQWCEGRIPAFATPRFIRLVDALPKTPVGEGAEGAAARPRHHPGHRRPAGHRRRRSLRRHSVDYTEDQTHSRHPRRPSARCARRSRTSTGWSTTTRTSSPGSSTTRSPKAGWLGLTIPEEYGGGGLGVTEAAIVEQEIAASGAGMGGCSAVHIGIFGFDPIIKHGSEDLKRRFLPRVATGDLHISFAVTEPDAGTDTTNISTFATKVDGGWSVTGKKVWITKAPGGRADAAAGAAPARAARAPSRPTA